MKVSRCSKATPPLAAASGQGVQSSQTPKNRAEWPLDAEEWDHHLRGQLLEWSLSEENLLVRLRTTNSTGGLTVPARSVGVPADKALQLLRLGENAGEENSSGISRGFMSTRRCVAIWAKIEPHV